MHFQYMINDLKLKNKSEATKNAGRIKANNTSKTRTVSTDIEGLATYVENGQTIVAAVLEDTEKLVGSFFKSQQLFLIDVDNKDDETGTRHKNYMTDQQIIELLKKKGFEPAIVYHSFSSRTEWHRLRVGFLTSEPITDIKERNDVLISLMKILVVGDDTIADKKCTDLSRISYGGRSGSVVHKNPEAVLSIKKLLDDTKHIHLANEAVSVPKRPQEKKTDAVREPLNNLIQSIMKKNPLQYKSELSNQLRKNEKLWGTGEDSLLSKNPTIYLYNNIISIMWGEYLNEDNPSAPIGNEDIFTTTSKFPLHEMLGLPLGEKISCILPGHIDSSPSATINRLDDGRYVYKCWGCMQSNHVMGVLDVFMKLMDTRNLGVAMEFIQKATGFNLQTEWQRDQRGRLDLYEDYLESEIFQTEHKELYSSLVRSNTYGVLKNYIRFAGRFLMGESLSKDGRPTFFISLRRASKILTDEGHRGADPSTLGKKINYLCQLGLLQKVSFDEMPREVQLKALAAKERAQEIGVNMRYVQDYLVIPDYNNEVMIEATEIIQQRTNLRARKQFISREQVINTFDKDVADSVYTQDRDRGHSDKVEKFYEKYLATAEELIEEHGFFTEKQLLAKLKGYSATSKQYLSGQCLPRLIKDMDLKTHKVNKEKRATYNIPKAIPSNSIVHTIA